MLDRAIRKYRQDQHRIPEELEYEKYIKNLKEKFAKTLFKIRNYEKIRQITELSYEQMLC